MGAPESKYKRLILFINFGELSHRSIIGIVRGHRDLLTSQFPPVGQSRLGSRAKAPPKFKMSHHVLFQLLSWVPLRMLTVTRV